MSIAMLLNAPWARHALLGNTAERVLLRPDGCGDALERAPCRVFDALLSFALSVACELVHQLRFELFPYLDAT